MLYVTDDSIKEFNNCDIRIHKVEVEKQPLHEGFVLTVLGYATPKIQWFEEETPHGFISSGDDMAKPVGYRVCIPYEIWFEARDKGLGKMIDYLEHCFPPFFEGHLEEIINKVVQQFYDFWRNRIR